MQAIVNIGGKQFKIAEGSRIKVPNMSEAVGDTVKFADILMLDDGQAVQIGSPTVKNVSVDAKILEHGRDRKVLIYKKKRRKGYQRKNGHRQGFTLIEIQSIGTAPVAKAKKTTVEEGK